jgi:oligopeptidase B
MVEKRPHEMKLHGHTRVDDYYWLRDDDRADPQVLSYLQRENGHFDEVMAPTAQLQKTLFEEMTGRLDPDDSSVPYLDHGYWYYSCYVPGKEYAVHARRKGSMDAAEELLLDCNARAEGFEYYQLSGLEVSDNQRYVAIAEDTVGRRINTIRVLDTRTGEFLVDEINNASSSLAWSADSQYLFYLNKDLDTLLAWQVMRHQLGTDSSEDVLVYEEADNTFYNALGRSRSKDYIFVYHHNTDTTEVQWLSADNPLGSLQPFLPRETGHEYDIDHANGRFFVRSNWEAPNFRVLTADLATAGDKSCWEELVTHREHAMVCDLQAFDDWLVLGERKDGLLQVRVLGLDGVQDRYLEGQEESFVMWPSGNVSTHTQTIRYGYSSLTTPTQTWEIDLLSGEKQLLKQEKVLGDFDHQNYRSGRMFISARDGTEIPVSLVHHQDTLLDGTAPALIYAYGAYGLSMDPWFRNSIVSLLDRGFVYAIAHIRGGEEMGRRWYDDGRLMNKMNSFTDFIDVTESLQAQNVVDKKRTFAMGGSAGGLLMGAVINMAPMLYQGVVAAVPFVDIVTTMLDDSIPLTTGEYNEWGNPNEKAAFEYMLSYSPYDQVSAQDYPNLMVTTGLHDSQVQYFEPAKWVAKLRELRSNDKRLIMYTNMDAGHGGASGRYRQYLETAQEFAFILDLAGLSE